MRSHPDPDPIGYWVQAELVAIATDLAEVVGGAIALPTAVRPATTTGGAITGVASLLLLAVQDRCGQLERTRHHRPAADHRDRLPSSLFVNTPPPGAVVTGLVPRFDGAGERAAGHRDARGDRDAACGVPAPGWPATGTAIPSPAGPGTGCCATRWDVGIAMLVAGTVNLAMLLVAATNL